MKPYKFSIMFCLFTLIPFIQCSDDNNQDNLSTVKDCSISWKLDGASDSEEPSICTFLESTFVIGLIGSDRLLLQIDNLTSPGSFDVQNSDANILLQKDAQTLIMVEGSINVTEFSNSKAKGNFSGTMRSLEDNQITGQAYNLSNGTFSANF